MRTQPVYQEAKQTPDRTEFTTRAVGENDRLHNSDRYVSSAPEATSQAGCNCPPFAIEGSTFLWYPWSLAAARALSVERSLSKDERQRAGSIANSLLKRFSEYHSVLKTGMSYQAAELILSAHINEELSARK